MMLRSLAIILLVTFSVLLPLQIAHHAMAAEHNSAFQFMNNEDRTNCAKTTCVINPASTFFVALFSRFSDAIKMLFTVIPFVALGAIVVFLGPARSPVRISSLSQQRVKIQQRK